MQSSKTAHQNYWQTNSYDHKKFKINNIKNTKKSPTQQKGQRFEELTQAYLEKHQLKFIAKNYSTRLGEIDLIMQDRQDPCYQTLVFIEVRYRKSQHFGGALESIDFRKQQRIIHAAHIYLIKNFSPQHYPPCRFDVVLVSGNFNSPQFEWIANAFECR